MKSILSLLLILSTILMTSAQSQQYIINHKNSKKPILIINDAIISSFDILDTIPNDKVYNLNIDKDGNLSHTYLFFDKKENPVIIKATVDQDVKVKSQKELNNFFGLDENNDVYVNGFLIENKNLSISSESIKAVTIIKADNLRLIPTVLNIKIE